MNGCVIISRPTPRVFANMLAVAACRSPTDEAGLRESVWRSLLWQRREHGSLSAALEAAEARRFLRLATGGAA